LPAELRPLVLGAQPHSAEDAPLRFAGLPTQSLTATTSAEPALVFDRTASFGYQHALNYQVVVNWIIAEHKSQGLFQSDYGRHQTEQFWLFAIGSRETGGRFPELMSNLRTR
jgi:hypothetical protein